MTSNKELRENSRQKLLTGAAIIRSRVENEFSCAGLLIDKLHWNENKGGGLFLNSPFQLINVVIGDWVSAAELVDTDLIIGFPDDNTKCIGFLELKIHRLIKAYANHQAHKRQDVINEHAAFNHYS